MALGRGAKRDKNGPLVVRVEQKLCRRCSEVKASDLFFHSKLSLDGLCTYCKACQKELNKQARAKRPDVLRPQVGSVWAVQEHALLSAVHVVSSPGPRAVRAGMCGFSSLGSALGASPEALRLGPFCPSHKNTGAGEGVSALWPRQASRPVF